MTLIACFFILMMAFANYDPVTFQKKAELMAKYFTGQNDTAEEPKTPMDELQEELEVISNKDKRVVIKRYDKEINITINIEKFFKLGSAALSSSAEVLVDRIIEKTKEKHKNVRVLVEGHTDNIPTMGHRYPTNWELSGASASTVIRRFQESGFEGRNLLAVGYGDTRPTLPNLDKDNHPIPTNQSRNRRIVLRIMEQPPERNKLGAWRSV